MWQVQHLDSGTEPFDGIHTWPSEASARSTIAPLVQKLQNLVNECRSVHRVRAQWRTIPTATSPLRLGFSGRVHTRRLPVDLLDANVASNQGLCDALATVVRQRACGHILLVDVNLFWRLQKILRTHRAVHLAPGLHRCVPCLGSWHVTKFVLQGLWHTPPFSSFLVDLYFHLFPSQTSVLVNPKLPVILKVLLLLPRVFVEAEEEVDAILSADTNWHHRISYDFGLMCTMWIEQVTTLCHTPQYEVLCVCAACDACCVIRQWSLCGQRATETGRRTDERWLCVGFSVA